MIVRIKQIIKNRDSYYIVDKCSNKENEYVFETIRNGRL